MVEDIAKGDWAGAAKNATILALDTWAGVSLAGLLREAEAAHAAGSAARNWYLSNGGNTAGAAEAAAAARGRGVGTATARRVKLRKGVRTQIEANQPRNAAGEMIDPNTGEPLKPGEIDVGHKPGQEWRRRKLTHEERGSTRKEVLDTENDPSLYQLEDRSSNRSHRYEKKE